MLGLGIRVSELEGDMPSPKLSWNPRLHPLKIRNVFSLGLGMGLWGGVPLSSGDGKDLNAASLRHEGFGTVIDVHKVRLTLCDGGIRT